MDYQTHEHDVIVIGAGGAGLRAAIEASAAGVSVGLVCKSLLGKAHTVMAEGGIAAALANVDERDNWKVHFADTMRGGQYVNNWRMAQLHAQEAPARVRELEAWGAVFDRTPDGRILQRNFGGHKYPRLAHVGDRTGLELIRTLQDHGIHRGIAVYMERTVVRLLLDGDRVAGALAYDRERGRFIVFRAKAIILASGGIGKAYKITSNSWEYTGDGHTLAYDAGAELIDMEFVQFHPTGMIWPPSVRGILVTEGVRGEGGVLRNKHRRAVHVRRHPGQLQAADRRRTRRRASATSSADKDGPPAAGAADARPRRPVHRPRGQGGPRQPARRRLPRTADVRRVVRQADRQVQRRGALEEEAAEHVPPVQGTRRARHHEGADGGRADDALRDGRRPGGQRHADVARPRACSPAASARPASTGRTGSAATRSRTCSCSASGPASTRRSTRRTTPAGAGPRRPGRGRGPVGAGAVRPDRRTRARSRSSRTCRT